MIVPVDQNNLMQAATVHALSWQESHRSFCTPDFIAQHTPERQAAYLCRKMEQGSRVFLLIDGEPVGVVSVTGSHIEDLYVLPERQNRGYGTALLRFAEGLCPDTPTLWILENNARARRLYERLGFSQTGRTNRITDKLSEIEFSKTEERRMETERLIIDRIGESDREDYFYNISHDRKVLEAFVCRYAETLEDFDFSNYLGRDDLFAIRLKETGRLIGIVLYFDEKDGACEIGYGIGSTYWGKGYATEAVRRFLTYLFDEKGMKTVTASFFTGNDASRRVMEKCGMTYQRFSPQEFEYHGAMRDLTYYAIESKPGGDRARIESFWHSVLRQDREALPQYFTPDAEVFWHCTNERFTAEEFIRVNCDYPGEWDGEIERFEPTPAGCVTAVHVFSKDRSVSCRVTSFFTFQGKRIARLDEYWADDGPVPDWRRTMRVGRPIR